MIIPQRSILWTGLGKDNPNSRVISKVQMYLVCKMRKLPTNNILKSGYVVVQ